MKKFSWAIIAILLVSFFVISEIKASTPSIIVDNSDSTGVTFVGTWSATTSNSGYYGQNNVHDGNTGKGSKSVTFTPNIPTAGQYEVYARWTSYSNRSTHVPIVVTGQNGSSTYTVNQQTQGGTWVLLGVHTFGAGTGNSVTIKNEGTEGELVNGYVYDGYVVADAVGFTMISPAADAQGPTVSGVTVDTTTDIDKSRATFNWTTNEPANGQIELLNDCPSTGCVTFLTPLSTTHKIEITGLKPDTAYPYRITTRDAAGNTTISQQSFSTNPIAPSGPLLSSLTHNSVKVFTRTPKPAAVKVLYKKSADSTFTTSNTINTVSSDDFTASIQLSGLLPNTQYDYQLHIDNALVGSNTFKTLPTPGQPSSFSFIIGSDFHGNHVPSQIMESMEAKNPLFNIHIGDLIVGDVGPTAKTTDEFRDKYQAVFAQSNLANFLGKRPTVYSWDDHEIQNNWDQGTGGIYIPARQAYDEYVALQNPSPRTSGNLYYSYKAGEVEFYVWDTRSFRSKNALADNSSKTMLGAAQKADFKNWLLNSTAKFKIVITSVTFTDFGTSSTDSWIGFKTERTELMNFISDNDVKGVMFVSGDQHFSFVAKLNAIGPTYNLFEIQSTPLGTKNRPFATTTDPQLLFHNSKALTYGFYTVDTTVSPATLSYVMYDKSNTPLYTMTITEHDINPTTPIVDSTPPVISSINVTNLNQSSATINWTTNEAADSQVEFVTGPCPGTTNCTTPLISGAQTSHSVFVTDLTANTTYTYVVKSKDAAGNLATSANKTFTTPAPIPGTPNMIMDNTGSGVTITGSWTATTSTPGYYGTNNIHDGNSGKGSKSVKYTPDVSGNYEVYARWSAYPNRATNVPIVVTDQNGSTTYTVNQQTQGGAWVLLGTHSFTAGTSNYVTIKNDGTNGFVMADAIGFTPAP